MRHILLATAAAALTLAGASAAQAATILGLFNTGTDASNMALAGGDGVLDPHYQVVSISPVDGVTPRPAVTYYNPAYVANDADSRWISISAGGTPGNNTSVYRLTFSLAGLNAATASITGRWGTDNFGSILLNGGATGNSLVGIDANNFNQLHAFTISSGFVAGINTLDFSVTDGGPPTALRVDDLAGTASLAGGVPEPATWAMMVLGFAGLGAVIRRRRAALAA